MSAQVLAGADVGRISERRLAEVRPIQPAGEWDPDRFARAQIRGLVRQTFSTHANRPVKQLVLCAVDRETDVTDICMQIGGSLSIETLASIAVVADGSRFASEGGVGDCMPEWSEKNRSLELKQQGCRVRSNMWLLPSRQDDEATSSAASMRAFMAEVRREFEYSIVQAPAVSGSNQAITMAQLADGIILVLSARQTRRAVARRSLQTLHESECHVLGTVLADREFPVPDGIYRRL